MNKRQNSGFSLIELLIGFAISLIASIVIIKVFSQFEQQKQATVGNADAQTNGAIGMYQIRRIVKNAGYGLPLFIQQQSPLLCYKDAVDLSAEAVTVDHDGEAGTDDISLSPVIIVDGGADGSDQLAIRFGDSATAAPGLTVTTPADSPITTHKLKTTLGCKAGDRVLMMNPGNGNDSLCSFTQVQSVDFLNQEIEFTEAKTAEQGSIVSCMGQWNEYRFAVANNELTVTGTRQTADGEIDATAVPITSEIVALQAQYGVADSAGSNVVTDWVDATGNVWGPDITVDNRNRIKAVRVAIVARNGKKMINKVVSQACDGDAAGVAKVCIWRDGPDGKPLDNATNVNLAGIADWQNYRYRVYETAIPLRNVLMNRIALE